MHGKSIALIIAGYKDSGDIVNANIRLRITKKTVQKINT